MDLLQEYGTDPAREAEGVWSAAFKGGIEVQLRSSQSPTVKAAHAKISKRNERYWKLKQDIPESVQQKNACELACAIVADWRLRTKTPGKPDVISAGIPLGGASLVATDDNKHTVFGDPRLWSFRLDVIAQANDMELFQLASDEDDAGNSAAPSAQASSSETSAT